MKRPKRAKVLIYKKVQEITYYVSCPHCKTRCVGIGEHIDRMFCFHCKGIIMLVWDEVVK